MMMVNKEHSGVDGEKSTDKSTLSSEEEREGSLTSLNVGYFMMLVL